MPARHIPRHLKLLRGTSRPDRDRPATGLPRADAAPPPPAWMNDMTARAEFTRLAHLLHVNGLLTAGKADALADYAMLTSRFQAMWREGNTPSGAMFAARRKLAGDLGLSALRATTASASTGISNRFSTNGVKR